MKSDTLIQDEMVNGATVVEGEGITMTLADPIAASQSDRILLDESRHLHEHPSHSPIWICSNWSP